MESKLTHKFAVDFEKVKSKHHPNFYNALQEVMMDSQYGAEDIERFARAWFVGYDEVAETLYRVRVVGSPWIFEKGEGWLHQNDSHYPKTLFSQDELDEEKEFHVGKKWNPLLKKEVVVKGE